MSFLCRTVVFGAMRGFVESTSMRLKIKPKSQGFTLVEMAVVVGGLGIVTLFIAVLVVGTTDTFGRLSSDTQSMGQLRNCLDVFSADIRESMQCSIVDPVVGDPQNPALDALLFTSARPASGPFKLDANGFPLPKSILLYYIGLTPEGMPQLAKHQLYYDEDLNPYTPPFVLADPAYSGDYILIRDNAGTTISVNRINGAVGGFPSLTPPRALMNNAMSFDVVRNGLGPIEITVESQITDRKGRVKTNRMSKQIVARNF